MRAEDEKARTRRSWAPACGRILPYVEWVCTSFMPRHLERAEAVW